MEFKAPANNEAIDIKIKYGKQILPNDTVNLNFSLRTSKPETRIIRTEGKNTITIVLKQQVRIKSVTNTSDKTLLASCFPSIFSTFENLGRKDELNAPSAKIFRNTLANFIAIRNASAHIPAPRQNAITHSRTNPATLLSRVNAPTVIAALIVPMVILLA
jgi:hypothetical protein